MLTKITVAVFALLVTCAVLFAAALVILRLEELLT
jgi:hypothetical protein